jgi:hypothetical protein
VATRKEDERCRLNVRDEICTKGIRPRPKWGSMRDMTEATEVLNAVAQYFVESCVPLGPDRGWNENDRAGWIRGSRDRPGIQILSPRAERVGPKQRDHFESSVDIVAILRAVRGTPCRWSWKDWTGATAPLSYPHAGQWRLPLMSTCWASRRTSATPNLRERAQAWSDRSQSTRDSFDQWRQPGNRRAELLRSDGIYFLELVHGAA